MIGICRDITEDNRQGVLQGLDKDGKPMRPTVRQGGGKKTGIRKKLYGTPTTGHYLGPKERLRGLVLKGTAGNGNLTSAEYAKLKGPPLAPRGPRSRSIANLIYGDYYQTSDDVWVARVGWVNVLSKNGTPILPTHFEGKRCGRKLAVKMPVRDLRGVRPAGMKRIHRRIADWAEDVIQGNTP